MAIARTRCTAVATAVAARTTLAATTTTRPYDAVAPSASRLSSQFSTAVQATTAAAPSTPAIPIQEPRRRDHVQPSANAATITASQPLFGPCVPLSVTGSSEVQVRKTPITTAAIAIRAAIA